RAPGARRGRSAPALRPDRSRGSQWRRACRACAGGRAKRAVDRPSRPRAPRAVCGRLDRRRTVTLRRRAQHGDRTGGQRCRIAARSPGRPVALRAVDRRRAGRLRREDARLAERGRQRALRATRFAAAADARAHRDPHRCLERFRAVRQRGTHGTGARREGTARRCRARDGLPCGLPAHAVGAAVDGCGRARAERFRVPPARNRRRSGSARPDRTMSAVPAASRLAALPLAAAQPQVPFAAADSSLPFDDPAGYALPGIDHVRVAIPHGSLAGHAVIVLQVESRLAPRAALAEVERHWRAQGADTILQAQAGEWFVLSRRANAGHHPLAPDGVEGFETLQLRASRHGGSEGLLTQWNRAPEASNADALARLVPSGAHVVRQLSSGGDAQRKATTLVAYFARSLDDAERQLDRHLRAE